MRSAVAVSLTLIASAADPSSASSARPNSGLTTSPCVSGVAFAPAVPELSTWGMLIIGFAGVGFISYRRKSKPALLAA